MWRFIYPHFKNYAMFVYYHNEHYFSMSFTKNGKRHTYKTKYFRFLLNKDIQYIAFWGSSLPCKFIEFTDQEIRQLEILELTESLNYN